MNRSGKLALKKRDKQVKPYFVGLLLIASASLLFTGFLLAIMMFGNLIFGHLAPIIILGLSILLLTKCRPILELAWLTLKLIFNPFTYISLWKIIKD